MESNLYPPSPVSVPDSLTSLNPVYKRQTVHYFLAVLLFLLGYVALIVGTTYLFYWAISYPVYEVDDTAIMLKMVAIFISFGLFIFAVKTLFKRGQKEDPNWLEVTEKNLPRLFAFIKKLANEMNVPMPDKVFVNEAVDITVYNNSSFFNLFFPARKNLLIGLGLVNSLNLSEFKAALAHEFGHFSKRNVEGMTYTLMANQIIYNMIYVKDKWVEKAKSYEDVPQLDQVAILFGVFIWIIRVMLKLFYLPLERICSSLEKEEEFMADRMAVRVAGSDALVHALARIQSSDEAMYETLQELRQISKHKIYAEDIFFHHQDYLQTVMKVPKDLPIGDGQQAASMVFEVMGINDPIPKLGITKYKQGQSYSEREQNAKEIYITGVLDARSAWLLFDHVETIQKMISQRLNESIWGLIPKKQYQPAEKVKVFIESARAENQRKGFVDLR